MKETMLMPGVIEFDFSDELEDEPKKINEKKEKEVLTGGNRGK